MRARLDSEEEMVSAVSLPPKKPAKVQQVALPAVVLPTSQPGSPPAGTNHMPPGPVMEVEGHLGWKVGSCQAGLALVLAFILVRQSFVCVHRKPSVGQHDHPVHWVCLA
jgi:hypothetical protein